MGSRHEEDHDEESGLMGGITPSTGAVVDIHSMHLCSAAPPVAASCAPRRFCGDADGVLPIAKRSWCVCPFSVAPHRAVGRPGGPVEAVG